MQQACSLETTICHSMHIGFNISPGHPGIPHRSSVARNTHQPWREMATCHSEPDLRSSGCWKGADEEKDKQAEENEAGKEKEEAG